MKNLRLILLGLFIASLQFSFTQTGAQGKIATAFSDIPRLSLGEIQIFDEFIEIPYEINFGGFVELHLKNDERETIWVKRVVNDKMGNYALRIARKPLEANKRYSFEIKYKGRDYFGSFVNEN